MVEVNYAGISITILRADNTHLFYEVVYPFYKICSEYNETVPFWWWSNNLGPSAGSGLYWALISNPYIHIDACYIEYFHYRCLVQACSTVAVAWRAAPLLLSSEGLYHCFCGEKSCTAVAVEWRAVPLSLSSGWLYRCCNEDIFFQGQRCDVDGILIFGLYLDGGRWDTVAKCLADSRPGHRFSRLPELVLQPTQVKFGQYWLSLNPFISVALATSRESLLLYKQLFWLRLCQWFWDKIDHSVLCTQVSL